MGKAGPREEQRKQKRGRQEADCVYALQVFK